MSESLRLPIKYRAYNSGGKGGQHSNKTLSAIEATVQLPDGRTIRANATTSKSQHVNKKRATALLLSRIKMAMAPVRERPDLTERVRTYHAVRNDVVDHASGEHRTYKETIEGRGFDELIDARREALEMRQAIEEA